MKPFHPQLWAVLILMVASSHGAWASDRAKEQRWADQIVDFLVVGEAVRLQTGEERFLGLFTEAATEPVKGAVIVIHGVGVHPDWQDVVAPLRTGLPEHGWATLSIQMPILAKQSAAARRTAGKAQGAYDQQEVAHADHFFRGQNERLLETVTRWLEPYGRSSSPR